MQQIAGFSLSTLHNRVPNKIRKGNHQSPLLCIRLANGDWESSWSQFQKVLGPSFSELFICWHFKSAPNSEILAQGKDN